MGKNIWFGFVFILVFLCAAVASVPLSFVMRQSGLAQQGISWQQARGTIWHGQVTGLVVQGDIAGAVEGDFSLWRFVRGEPGHLLHWNGPHGRGTALASLSPDRVRIRKGQAVVTFDATRISSAFPAQDVSLRLSNISADLGRSGCRAASGAVSTDALARVSAVYGAEWPELQGSLSCDGGALVVSVKGKAADGTQIAAKAYLDGGGQLELWDVPDGQTNALLLSGFTNQAGRFVYTQQSGSGETNQ
jgi:general secretion pathway protein N